MNVVFVAAIAGMAVLFVVMISTAWQPQWLRGRSDARLRGAGGLTLLAGILLAWLFARAGAPALALLAPAALWGLSLVLMLRADRNP